MTLQQFLFIKKMTDDAIVYNELINPFFIASEDKSILNIYDTTLLHR